MRTAGAVGPQWPVTLVAKNPVEITGNAARLRQIVDNFLANVRAHTPPGTSATVTVRTEEDMAVIEVADAGTWLHRRAGGKGFRAVLPDRRFAFEGTRRGGSRALDRRVDHGGARRQCRAAPAPGGGALFAARIPLAGPARHENR